METYTLSPRQFIICDRPKQVAPLANLFQDSHTMFKMRIQHLGNTKKVTTDQDSETLRVMLEALICAKQQLQSK